MSLTDPQHCSTTNDCDGFINHYISLCVGTVLYGFFLVSFFWCAYAFTRQGQGKWGMYIIAVVLFALVTLDIGLEIVLLQSIVQYSCIPDSAAKGSYNPMPWRELVKVS